jgi:RecJ-like exonuclease
MTPEEKCPECGGEVKVTTDRNGTYTVTATHDTKCPRVNWATMKPTKT